jgi:hypothetical protein
VGKTLARNAANEKTKLSRNPTRDQGLGTYQSEEEVIKRIKSGGGAHLARRRRWNA